MTLRTEYEFTLPRGYVDQVGSVHRDGVMRLATARDELEPLRHPTVTGPDDPRLTILILARVVTKLGTVPMVTANEIEGLFAADLAFLQDFYGVINFGTQEEYEAFLDAQAVAGPAAGREASQGAGASAAADAEVVDGHVSGEGAGSNGGSGGEDDEPSYTAHASLPGVRTRVERVPSKKSAGDGSADGETD